MNDLILAGLVIVGTLIAAGGGAWISKVIFRKNEPKA